MIIEGKTDQSNGWYRQGHEISNNTEICDQ